jgi:tRNA (guanine-N7-)-methyltransferase
VAVEIGFGKGSFLTELARQHPDWQVLGVEVRKKYCYLTASKLARAGVQNARLLLGDARDLLPRFVGPGTIDLLFIMFPDPWWKRRHFKKRILEPRFLADLAPLMRPGAELVVRSDVALVIDLARQAAAESGRFRECPGPAPALPDTDRERACRKREIAVSQIRFALG